MDSSKSSKQSPAENYELEQELDESLGVVKGKTNSPKKSKKPSADVSKEKRQQQKKAREDAFKQNLEAELRTKLEIELRTQLEAELETKLENELKPQIEESLRIKLETELKETIEADIKPTLEANLRTQLEAEFSVKLENELKTANEKQSSLKLEHELKEQLTNEAISNFETELKPELESQEIAKVEAAIRIELERELKDKLEADELKPRLEAELILKLEHDLSEKLKPQLETEISKQLLTELRPQIETKLRIELETELKNQIVANQHSETKSKLNSGSTLGNAIDCNMDTKRIVEAILFAADKPMTAKQIQNIYPEIERPELKEIQAAINSITEDYESRSVILKQLASGYRFQVKDGYSYWVSRLFEDKPSKYSRAVMETIAIIAYRQPVTRGDIEDIRGVSVSTNIIRTLLDREWVRVIAHKEVPGRPALYGTTKQFLDYFNLSSLEGLPTLEEIKEIDFSASHSLNSENQQTVPQAEIDNARIADNIKVVSEEQRIEEQASETQTIIEPISETRH